MPVFLDTRGNATLGIGICGRCSRKFPIGQLHSDPNVQDLMVCKADLDNFDPYRLPARQTENIKLPFARPDVDISTDPNGVVTQDDDSFLITQDGEEFLTP